MHLIDACPVREQAVNFVSRLRVNKSSAGGRVSSIYPALIMVEPLLSGIVLGLIPVTLAGLFVTAYLQYRRGDQLNIY